VREYEEDARVKNGNEIRDNVQELIDEFLNLLMFRMLMIHFTCMILCSCSCSYVGNIEKLIPNNNSNVSKRIENENSKRNTNYSV